MIRKLDKLRARGTQTVCGAVPFRSKNRFVAGKAKSTACRAFTLVEVLICLVIVLMAGIGTVAAVVYTRLNMELEKQRLAALNYCRQSMEAVQSLDDAYAATKSLVPFNAPGIEDLNANVRVEYFQLLNTGTVDWNTSLTAPSLERPVYARVSVRWLPYGSVARTQEVMMSTIVTRGID